MGGPQGLSCALRRNAPGRPPYGESMVYSRKGLEMDSFCIRCGWGESTPLSNRTQRAVGLFCLTATPLTTIPAAVRRLLRGQHLTPFPPRPDHKVVSIQNALKSKITYSLLYAPRRPKKSNQARYNFERRQWLMSGTVTSKDLRAIYIRDHGCCVYCNTLVKTPCFTKTHLRGFDHVLSRREGGQHEKNNIVVACNGCNVRKSYPREKQVDAHAIM